MPFSPAPETASTIAASASETRNAAAIKDGAPIVRDPLRPTAKPRGSGARAVVFVLLTGLLLRIEETLRQRQVKQQQAVT